MHYTHKRIVKAIKEVCEESEGDFSLRSYSGRGMYGKECVGITCGRFISEFQLAAKIAATLHWYNDTEALEELALLEAKSDSMGLNSIIYFPRMTWEKEYEGDLGQ